ncbi:MAG: hypothetical protein AAGD00_07325 [Planctomycetota bacterium]
MQFKTLRRLAWLVPLIAFAVSAPSPGQVSIESLRQENQELKRELTKLRAQLRTAESRTKSLEQQNMRLRDELLSNGITPPSMRTSGGDAGDVPEEPGASFDSMFNAVVAAWNEEFADVPLETRRDEDRYLRELRPWTSRLQRDLRSNVQWTVAIESVEEIDRTTSDVRMLVLDPETGEPIGRAGWVRMNKRFADRFASAAPDVRWDLVGTLTPEVAINEDRFSEGIGGQWPLFVGPFAEFDIELNIRSLKEAEGDESP